MRTQILLMAMAIVVSLPAVASLAGDAGRDWPSFRGPNRNGVSPETGLLQKWPEGGPRVVWDVSGPGRGYASLAVAGERIFTLGDASSIADDQDEYLLAFDRDTGKPLWQLKTGAAWNQGKPNWQSSRSTPTIESSSGRAASARRTSSMRDSRTSWKRSGR